MFEVSLFSSARDNKPKIRRYDEDKLSTLLGTWRPGASKEALPAWSPATFAAGKTRSKSAAESVSCLVLDLDDGMPVEAARDCFGGLGLSVLLHTSWSHTAEVPKWRLVLPLMRPVPALEWPRAWRWALSWWAGIAGDEWTPDTRCSDASRLYFLPAWRADQPRVTWRVCGWLLDIPWWDVEVEKPAPRAVVERSSTVSGGRAGAEIRRRLATCPTARAALGRQLRGVVGGGLVRRVVCPGCGRPAVWWLIDPHRKRTAECNHRNSCGWYGRLDDLAYARGMEA